MNQMSMMGLVPVLLVSPELRRPVRNLIERFLPQMMVISHKEVAHGIQVTTEGEIGVGLAAMINPQVGQQASSLPGAGGLQPSMAQ